jgi:hypothetical protein
MDKELDKKVFDGLNNSWSTYFFKEKLEKIGF